MKVGRSRRIFRFNTVSPSQPRPPRSSPVFSQDSRELQCHWAVAQWHWLSCVLSALDDSLPAETPRPDHARRAVDVNRPVTPRCVPAATLAARLQTVTGGLTSPARLDRSFVVLDRKPMPLGCRPAARAADGRKPPVAFRTEGARAGQGRWPRVDSAVYPRAAAQWHWLCGRRRCREGEAPAEPHPCCERCTDPCCSVKLLAIVDRADPRAVARQEPRPGMVKRRENGEIGIFSLCLPVDISSVTGRCQGCWSHAKAQRRKVRTKCSLSQHFILAPLRLCVR